MSSRRWFLYGFSALLSCGVIGIAGFLLAPRVAFLQSVFGGRTLEKQFLPVGATAEEEVSIPLETLLSQADQLLQEGNVRDAITLYERALANGGDVPVLRRIFDAALLIGDEDRAESTLGLMTFRGVPERTLDALRGLLLLHQGKLEEAKTLFAADPNRSEYRFGLLLTALLSGEYSDVRLHAETLAQSTDPFFAHAAKTILGAEDEFALFEDGRTEHRMTLHARAIGQLGMWSLAARLLEEAVTGAPQYRDAHILLGYAHLMMEQPEEALTSFETAYALDPEKSETQYFLGRAYEKKGDIQQARMFYGYALQNGFEPKNALRERLLRLALREGAAEEAERIAMAMVESGEADAAVYRTLITLVIEGKDLERARLLAARAQEELGEDPTVLELVGWTAFLAENMDEAALFLRLAVEQDPTLATAWFRKGIQEEAAGALEEARTSFRKAYDHSIGLDDELARQAAERHNALLEI